MVVYYNQETYEVFKSQEEMDNCKYIQKLDNDDRIIAMYNTGMGLVHEIVNYDERCVVFMPDLGHVLLVNMKVVNGCRELVVLTDDKFKELTEPVTLDEALDYIKDRNSMYHDYMWHNMIGYYSVSTEDIVALSEVIKNGWTKAKAKVKQLRNKNK